MNDADKRRRALELFNKFSTNPSITNNEEIAAAMLAFAAECEAAAIERCEKVCREADKSTHPSDLADAIAKLREGE